MPDLLDQLLSVGSTPDWISPLSAIIQDFTNGPYHRFYVDRYAGWSVNEIKRLLKRQGVHVWGDTIADDMMILTVRQAQAQWAQYLLQRAGVPILGGLVDKPAASTIRARPTKTTSPSVWEAFFGWLDEL